jgi:hypothetical protein
VEKNQGKNYLGDLNVDAGMILKWILNTWAGGMDWIDLVQDNVSGCCECFDESHGSTKRGEILEQPRTS